MSLGQHLVELRKRLTRSGVAILLAAIGGFFLADIVWRELSRPLLAIAEDRDITAQINYTAVTEAFDTQLIIAITLGIIIASPIWIYQLWAYVLPALKRNEKRYAIGFLAASLPLFLIGCVAGWLVLPNVVTLLTGFAPADSTTLLTARYYLDFSLKFILAIGVGFVLPVVLVILNFARILAGESILKSWRWAILAITAFTALATPAADVLSMLMLAIPMIGLYFIATAIAMLHDKAVARRDAKLAAEYGIPVDD